MYSKEVFDSHRLIEEIFIVGITNFEFDLIKNYSLEQEYNSKPVVWYSIPKKTISMQNTMDFLFPSGFNISNTKKQPTIYSIVLTNDKMVRSYIYVLLFYDKLNVSEENLQHELTKSEILNANTIFKKTFYCPIAICIRSYISNIDFFRKWLLEYYRTINFNLGILGSKCSKVNEDINEKVLSFQKVEWWNLICFSVELMKPPFCSMFNLNTRFCKIGFTSQSKLECPSSEYCTKILFECLEVNTIIKLFIAMLLEKHIILIGNQSMSWFCIWESLLQLIFPFKWWHSYIPNLPQEQLAFWESPIPYFMGILDCYVNITELTTTYTNHIICDITTSQIFGKINCKLPYIEEVKIRKKWITWKTKFMNLAYDDVTVEDAMDYDYNKTRIFKELKEEIDEDVSESRSFGENVRLIFFRIFRTYWSSIKENYVSNNIFNAQKFLNSFSDSEHKAFFEKLVCTQAFEDFILSMQYLDDSFSRQFNWMCNEYKNTKKEKDYNNGKVIRKVMNSGDSTCTRMSRYYRYDYTMIKSIDNAKLNNKDIKLYNDISDVIEQSPFSENATDNIIPVFSESNTMEMWSQKNMFHTLGFYHKNGFLEFLGTNFPSYSARINTKFKTEIKWITNQILKITNVPAVKTSQQKVLKFPNTNNSQFYLNLAYYQYNEWVSNPESYPSQTTENDIYNTNTKQYLSNLVFKLLIKAFELERVEFPRNLFYTMWSIFSNKEWKLLQNSSHRFISKAIQCELRRLDKVKYKTMVICSSESEDTSEEDPLNTSVQSNDPLHPAETKTQPAKKTSTTIIRPRLRKKNTIKISIYKADDSIVYEEEKQPRKSKNNININININNLESKSKVQTFKNKNYLTEKDPLALSERICMKWYSILISYKLESVRNVETLFDSNWIREIAKNEKFLEVKGLILWLKKISLSKISQNATCYYCFWLNWYNFLTLFAIIMNKCEAMSTFYEWYRFLKNSYYSIDDHMKKSGNFETDLRGNADAEIENLPRIDYYNALINYGISIPTVSSPALRIYFPFNFYESLRMNAVELFSRVVNIDLERNVINIPEYFIWVEQEFINKIKYYEKILPKEIIGFISETQGMKEIIKSYIWKMSFENIKRVQCIE